MSRREHEVATLWNAHTRALRWRKGENTAPNDKNVEYLSKNEKSQFLANSSDVIGIDAMEPYGVYLVALGFLNVALAYHRHHAQKQEILEESLALPSGENKAAATKFKWEYFTLYSLVMAADWLQVS